ncbi:hypothetical protein [Scytonema sp. UIC 10036]|uniref:hypothetical protein n=1 Tax=Scytonema sp. UIC 10036 TaxID=2304196 RepID=UPI001A9BFE4A|nr:hypothetical protein [Scytonema sp. UIC 10036]
MLKFLQSSLWAIALLPALLNTATSSAIAQQAEASIEEDLLNTVSGFKWGGVKGWSYSKVVEIKDGLVGTVVGKVVLDRHGDEKVSVGEVNNVLDIPLNFIKRPFASPLPGRWVVVSLWGSKIDGCFSELIFQIAPSGNTTSEAIAPALVPKVLELGVNNQIIELVPQPTTKERSFSQNYTYTENKIERSSTWYMARNLFRIDSNIANILSNASGKEIRARITFANGESFIFPIGEKTVKRWKDAYSFNPSCTNLRQTQPVAEQPQQPIASAPSQPASGTSSSQRDSGAPVQKPTTNNRRTVGNVALAATQTLNNVVIQIDGATVQNSGSYTANLMIQNNSDRSFGFVPVSVKVEDSNGKPVKARLVLKSAEKGVISPQGTLKGQLLVIGQRWKDPGPQNLILVIREATTGGRAFRIPF